MKKLLIRITELMLSSILIMCLVACGGRADDEISDKEEHRIVKKNSNEDESGEVTKEAGWALLEAYLIENGEYSDGQINPTRKGEKYIFNLPMENGDELRLSLCVPDEGDRWMNISFVGERRGVRHYAEYYTSKKAFHDNCVPNKSCPIDPATITRNTFYTDFEVYDNEVGNWVKMTDEADLDEENEILISLLTYFCSFAREELGLSMSDFGFYDWDLE